MADNIFKRIASFITKCCYPETDNATEMVFSVQKTHRYSDGSHYNGKWKNGKKHGEGEMRYSNGSVYKGE